jgi:hypothetical protein
MNCTLYCFNELFNELKTTCIAFIISSFDDDPAAAAAT